jgi:glycolate dehydrogenase iron-sulfur subunit
MSLNPILERHKGELDKCVTCAICQPVCPTFQLSGLEKLSPRGRIVLLRRMVNGDIDPSYIADDTFNYCTLCYACQTACPAGVKTDLLFIGARQEVAAAKGLPKTKQKVFATLESPDRVEKAVRLGAIAQKTLGSATVNRIAGGMVVPPLRGKPVLKELPDVIEPDGDKVRATVAFFAGCMSNYVDARAAYASLEVLRRLGVRVLIPKQQVCCGAPAFNNGDFSTAESLAATNLALFEDPEIDAVISPDATCGGAFKHEIPELVWDNDELAVSAQLVAGKTMDWAGFVLSKLDPRFQPTREPDLKITVHDSCHLTHTQQAHSSVHQLLERLPGVEIVPLPESSVCCGFGGSFSAMYPDDAAQWAGRKLDAVGQTGAEIGIVSSPGCLNHLDVVRSDRREINYRLMHPAELISERYGWAPSW